MNKIKAVIIEDEFPAARLLTYSGAYPFTFQQLIKHKNSL